MSKKLILLIISALSSFLIAQAMNQEPTRWQDLPKELKSYIFSLNIDQTNTKSMLRELKKLARVNQESFHLSRELIYGPQAIEKFTQKENKLLKQFFNAAFNGDIEVVKLLLNLGVDVNAKDDISGCTALMFATQNNYKKLVQILLERGADVNAQVDDSNSTPLMAAVQRDNKAIVKILLDAGANIDAEDYYGITPSMFTKDRAMLKLLKNCSKNNRNGE